jgi:hypothetical protein
MLSRASICTCHAEQADTAQEADFSWMPRVCLASASRFLSYGFLARGHMAATLHWPANKCSWSISAVSGCCGSASEYATVLSIQRECSMQGMAVAASLLSLTTLTALDFSYTPFPGRPLTGCCAHHGPALSLARVLPFLCNLRQLAVSGLLPAGTAASALCAALTSLKALTQLSATHAHLTKQRLDQIATLVGYAPFTACRTPCCCAQVCIGCM